MDRPVFDVVVIGAGAAGLAAAAALAARHREVCVLEARDRLGGRILTTRDAALAVPVELGAEFVHGRSAVTSKWLAAANSTLVDMSEERFLLEKGKLVDGDDLFPQLKSRLERVRRPRKDMPFAEFLAGPARKHVPPLLREFATMLVEGYDAADATRVSTLGILDEWCGHGGADATTFRPQGGYASLVGALANALDPAVVHIRRRCVVREVHWQRGSVVVTALQHGHATDIAARQCIVTLPLGILQLPPQAPNGVRFVPALTAKQDALAGLATGPVIKIALQFREPFWERLDGGRYAHTAFFHAPGNAFPTFWTTLPTRTALLTAWTAGPAAAALAGIAEPELVQTALSCACALFGDDARCANAFANAHLHDWQADPYAGGAYSFVVAGGANARDRLAEPLDDTLFFAGEAAETEGESGTVAGALASGERAAEQLLASTR